MMMRTKPRALFAKAATGLAVVLATSACAGTPSGSSGPGASSSPIAVANVSQIPCQPSAAELYNYLQDNKAMFDKALKPIGLAEPMCSDKYAIAPAIPGKGVIAQTEYVLFSYDVQNTRWTVLAVGATGICAGKVPAAVVKVLTTCFP